MDVTKTFYWCFLVCCCCLGPLYGQGADFLDFIEASSEGVAMLSTTSEPFSGTEYARFASWQPTEPGTAQSIIDLNLDRINHQKLAMYGLGGWALTNIGVSAALRGGQSGPARHFHDMNIYWNLFNLGIAGFGLYTVLHEDPGNYSALETIGKHYSFQKVLLFNAGLDVGYVLGGLYLTERSKRGGEDEDRLKGFGQSVMLQGGFLFVFDLVNYFISAGRDEDLRVLLRAGENGLGVGLVF